MLNLLRHFKNLLFRTYYEKRANLAQSPYEVAFRSQPFRILLILSHMRSGSSLLTHILSSNPEVIGYGETDIKYYSDADIKELICRVYTKTSANFTPLKIFEAFKMDHTYVLDKLLHGNLQNQEILKSDLVYPIVLLREPERTLQSILDLRKEWTEERALSYYTGRLKSSIDYVKSSPASKPFFFVTYQQIVHETESVLCALKNFLETKHEFSEQYLIQKTTGQPWIGDPVGHIKAGKIVREARPLETHVSPEVIERARQEFERAVQELLIYCTTIETLTS